MGLVTLHSFTRRNANFNALLLDLGIRQAASLHQSPSRARNIKLKFKNINRKKMRAVIENLSI